MHGQGHIIATRDEHTCGTVSGSPAVLASGVAAVVCDAGGQEVGAVRTSEGRERSCNTRNGVAGKAAAGCFVIRREIFRGGGGADSCHGSCWLASRLSRDRIEQVNACRLQNGFAYGYIFSPAGDRYAPARDQTQKATYLQQVRSS